MAAGVNERGRPLPVVAEVARALAAGVTRTMTNPTIRAAAVILIRTLRAMLSMVHEKWLRGARGSSVNLAHARLVPPRNGKASPRARLPWSRSFTNFGQQPVFKFGYRPPNCDSGTPWATRSFRHSPVSVAEGSLSTWLQATKAAYWGTRSSGTNPIPSGVAV